MSEWQPIETAPKDGRQVLLVLAKSGGVTIGGFDKLADRWILVRAGGFELAVKEFSASHWMKVPDPPKAEG